MWNNVKIDSKKQPETIGLVNRSIPVGAESI